MTQIHIMLDLETWGTTPGSDIRSIGAALFDPSNGAVNLRDGEEHPSHFYIACDNPAGVERNALASEKPNRPGNRLFIEIDNDEMRKYPLTRDPKTVQWWSEKSEEAHAAFTNPVDLRDALQRFTTWLNCATNHARPIEYPSSVVGQINRDGSAEMIDVRAYGRTHDQPIALSKWDGLRLWAHGPSFDVSILDTAYRAVNLPTPWHYRAPRDTRTAFDMANVGDHSVWLQQFNHGTAHNALDDAISQARAVCAAYERLRLPHDIKTHRDAWAQALLNLKNITNDDNGSGYYTHELKAFDRTFEALDRYPNID